VRSDGVGTGSEFIVHLPAIVTDSASAPPSDPVESEDQQRGQPPLEREFLVVDDNEDAARLLGDVLTEKGYQTRLRWTPQRRLRRQWSYDPRSRS